jgi:hypothetical protein
MIADEEKAAQSFCKNCDRPLPENSNFCPGCGQDNHSHKKPILHFLEETLESTLHFDTKFFTTIKDLFRKPGLASINYNNDRRARYVPPVRLYIFTSFIFFLIMNLTDPSVINIPEPDIEVNDSDTLGKEADIHNILTEQERELLSTREELSTKTIDSLIAVKKMQPGTVSQSIIRMIHHKLSGEHNEAKFRGKLFKNISIAMFLLMPLFALLLQIFFFRARKFYTEHLVLSLHLHTLLFITLLFLIGISMLTDIDLTIVLIASMLSYLFIALKNVYGGSWLSVGLKTLGITSIYLIFIMVSLFVSTIISAM